MFSFFSVYTTLVRNKSAGADSLAIRKFIMYESNIKIHLQRIINTFIIDLWECVNIVSEIIPRVV